MRAVHKVNQDEKISPMSVSVDFDLDDIEHVYDILCDVEESGQHMFRVLRRRLSDQLQQSESQTVIQLSLSESELEHLAQVLREYSDHDQILAHIEGAHSLLQTKQS
jgi:hypothetical protein